MKLCASSAALCAAVPCCRAVAYWLGWSPSSFYKLVSERCCRLRQHQRPCWDAGPLVSLLHASELPYALPMSLILLLALFLWHSSSISYRKAVRM